MKFYCEYYDKLNNFVDIHEIVEISKQIFDDNPDEYLMNIYINHNIFFLIRNGKYMREYYEDKYKLFKKWYNELFNLDNPSYYEKLNNKLYDLNDDFIKIIKSDKTKKSIIFNLNNSFPEK